ncbi:hypothetical protein Taro_051031 [Colocasia esculenta]|uniref:Uncharacterized protein n=1 Tax=Colocasia esculenta TaxID=4460 RepID=A0A843XFW9_COLES|nr:hypothetical protein [Colocasia esculenta]
MVVWGSGAESFVEISCLGWDAEVVEVCGFLARFVHVPQVAVVVVPRAWRVWSLDSLRCAVGLAGAFWRVFPERCLGGSGEGSPKTCLCCFCSSTCYNVLSDVFSRFRGPVLGCQSMVAPACVASRPCGVPGVWGGSTCGPSTLCRSEVDVLAVRRHSHLVAAWCR